MIYIEYLKEAFKMNWSSFFSIQNLMTKNQDEFESCICFINKHGFGEVSF